MTDTHRMTDNEYYTYLAAKYFNMSSGRNFYKLPYNYQTKLIKQMKNFITYYENGISNGGFLND